MRLAVAAWDAARPLVIDPVLVFSTYLGGSLHNGCSPTPPCSGNDFGNGESSQQPVHRGGRLSRKAAIPSWASSERATMVRRSRR